MAKLLERRFGNRFLSHRQTASKIRPFLHIFLPLFMTVGLFMLFIAATCSYADGINAFQAEQIKKQLQILEKSATSLDPEQVRAIRKIREIIDNRPKRRQQPVAVDPQACNREMSDNMDGTFTFVMQTNNEIQYWVLPTDSNEFNQGMTWFEAIDKVNEFEMNGLEKWELPPPEVLQGIYTISINCPDKLRKITGNPIIQSPIYHFPYWTANEYSFADSQNKTHADTVSLYSGNIIHERKDRIGILWPAKRVRVEKIPFSILHGL